MNTTGVTMSIVSGGVQYNRLAGQEQGSNQRMRCHSDAIIQGTPCVQLLQGTR